LFEPFVTTKQDGTGLGLAIAQGIIEEHGGRIWNETDCEEGTVFRFTLPLCQPSDLPGEFAAAESSHVG
jgi:signal transduction histidine kinase